MPDLQVELRRELVEDTTEIAFDLQGAVMLDSSGIGLLVASNSLARERGSIRVVNASTDIFQLLRSMRLVDRLHVSGPAAREMAHG